jgi:hypothetical protein
MSVHRDEQQDMELVRALGRVIPPHAAVLAAARESFWSQLADEMLSADLTTDAIRQPQAWPNSAQRPAPRRKSGEAPQPRRRQAGG